MANQAFVTAESNTGTCTATVPAGGNQVCWNLSSLSVSQTGGNISPNARVTIWDGAVGGTKLFACFLSAPGAGTWNGTGGLGGSTGIVQEIPLPMTPGGVRSVQATPGNAMNIQVIGTGNNSVIINARLSDGIPQ